MMNIEKIRMDFPILQKKINDHQLVYLDNAATTQKPKPVIDSIVNFYVQGNANIHRGIYQLSEQASNNYESIRKKVKDFINAEKSHEIIFTSGTTESINLIADSFGRTFLNKNDELIISEMEHHSNIIPWQMLCKRKKSSLKIVSFHDNGDLNIDQLRKTINEKTKLIAITHLSNVLGTINPIKEICSLAHKKNIPVLVDGAQAIQHLKIDVQDLDCDFYVFSAHKMYADTGLGVLYAKEKWLQKLEPTRYGGGMISKVTMQKTTFAEIPFKFEAGTQNISAVHSLGSAIDYLNNIGIDSIHQYEKKLLSYALNKLNQLNGITIYGTSSNKSSIISFNIDHVHHYDAVMILDKLGIAVRSGTHCAEPIMNHYHISGCIRVSIAFYNTTKDIDHLIKGIKKVQEMHKLNE